MSIAFLSLDLIVSRKNNHTCKKGSNALVFNEPLIQIQRKRQIIKARWRVLKSHEYLGGDNKMKSAHQSTG
jgi:hypothetical protein